VFVSLFVEAVAWTAIALLATTLAGSFFHVGRGIDALGAWMDDHLDRHAG
jgi:hypothetical protein